MAGYERKVVTGDRTSVRRIVMVTDTADFWPATEPVWTQESFARIFALCDLRSHDPDDFPVLIAGSPAHNREDLIAPGTGFETALNGWLDGRYLTGEPLHLMVNFFARPGRFPRIFGDGQSRGATVRWYESERFDGSQSLAHNWVRLLASRVMKEFYVPRESLALDHPRLVDYFANGDIFAHDLRVMSHVSYPQEVIVVEDGKLYAFALPRLSEFAQRF